MKTLIRRLYQTLFALLGFSVPLVLALSAPTPACQAAPPPYSVEILVDGQPRPLHTARGTNYVEALRGREYSIRLRNNTGRRVAVSLSVDGLNTIDARTTPARRAPKWVLDPWETAVVSGWQTGFETARRFYFTTEEGSYGAWLGQTENLGLVSAAFFREAERPRHEARRFASGSSQAPKGAARQQNESGAGARREAASEAKAEADDYAATGIGREIDARVRTIDVDLEPNPAAMINVRYEYRDALVRLGVLPPVEPVPDPLARRERARGFTDFAPDPYR